MRIDRFTCEETFRRLDDYLDRELSAREMRWVQEHLEVCAFCAAEFAFEAGVLERVRSVVSRIEARPGLAERIRRSLAGTAGPGGPSPRPTPAAGPPALGTHTSPQDRPVKESGRSAPQEGQRPSRGGRAPKNRTRRRR